MLKAEQAEEELKKIRVEKWQSSRLEALKKLPAHLRKVARPLVGVKDDGEDYEYDEHKKLREEIRPLAAGMTKQQRVDLFETLFPGLGNTVEDGWQLLSRLPHQLDMEAKSFRFPGNEPLLLKQRLQWVEGLLGEIGPYPNKDLAWHAAWTGHHWDSESISTLLAAAIDAGGKVGSEIFEILCASARGEHEVGIMGRHVVQSLLCASRPDGWEFIEKMLLAAKREEGLRQTILESVDSAHPEAFRRILRVILDNNLVRFSATVRALDVWVGYMWDSVSTGVANKVIEKLLLYLEDADARSKALKGKDPEQAYLALWAIAFDDANAALKPAGELLRNPKPEFRFVAARLLAQSPFPESQQMLLSVLHDKDLHLTCCALQPFEYGELDEKLTDSDFFEQLEKLLAALPEKPIKLKPLVWPWTDYTVGRELVSEVIIRALGKRPATRLIPHLPKLSNYERSAALEALAKPEKVGSEARDAFLDWIGDKTGQVRDAALAGLAKCEVKAADAPRLENLLTRTAGDLRRGVLGLLLKLSDADALASADRLMAAGAAPQRLAGLELLRQLTDSKRCLAEARERAAAYRKSHPKLAAAERQQIENIENARAEKLSLDDALGLLNNDGRTWPARPVNRKAILHTPATVRFIAALDELVHQHRETKITYEGWNDQPTEEPLSEVHYSFPNPKPELSFEADRARLPLADIWEKFWAERPKDLRDDDGFEALRAWAWRNNDCSPVFRKRCKPAVLAILGDYKNVDVRYPGVVSTVLKWFIRLHPPAGGPDFVLDAMETAFALVPETELRYLPKEDDWEDENWRGSDSPFTPWDQLASSYDDLDAKSWTDQHSIRLYHLSRWCDQPFGKAGNTSKDGRPLPRERPVSAILLAAHHAGGATDADLIEQILGPRDVTEYGLSSFDDLKFLTSREGEQLLKKYPAGLPLLEKCRARVIEVELTRGDTPTPASRAALDLERVYGISNLVAFLHALGPRGFTRDLYGAKDNKEGVFSSLIKHCFPAGGETVEDFKKQVTAAQIPEQRLVELAVYVPLWAPYVEFALGWDGLLEAVWWTHGHTRGADLDVDDNEEDADDARWKADISRRTPLTPGELRDGAVDVAWFQGIHKALGDKRWEMVSEAAKYASTAGGHTRARLFADAMLNRVTKKELLQRMMSKRYQDAVRALGLLPLAEGKSRETDLLDRYKAIQEFIRTGRQFGSQRQASEKRAAQIGQENLARTAGYPDPIRLQWAMEARAVADLADGPIKVTVDGVTVSLGIDVWGEVELTVTKDGKTLSDIPPKLKKDKKVAALRERKTELKRQASRIRIALETFMCRGEHVTGAELQELMKHPLLAPMLSGLVLVGEGVMGYPINDGKVLQDHSGNKEALKKDEKVRIAHPIDLLPASKWHEWQTDCFARERIQPFKQVFRELYTITKPEKDEGTQSRRYAGHQVQPRKAMALLGARGWVHHPEEGVRKTYHDAGIIVWLEFDESFYTPAEIEGLTLESVHFTNRSDGKPVKLTEIDPRLFSETMRDLDLVVSVAHRGGVDPEASASTLEMRASLVRETAALLKLPNVRIKDNHVYIKGELGEYSVHLGSAIARKIPGDMLFIVAVHSQHRGRIFLPFADNDPRTAEVMSKVLLLARDKDIKDPSIIEQIRR
jgi:Family of unknown function (DUF5724)/Domain of unknown function (DUF4132)